MVIETWLYHIKIYLNNEEKTEFEESLSRNLHVWDTTTINNSKNNDAKKI